MPGSKRAALAACSAACLLLSAACSQEPAASNEGEAAADSNAAVTPGATTTGPAVGNEAGQPAERAEKEGAAPAPIVPLTAGVYVIAGENCRNPANAGWRVWNGEGLSGSSTTQCRATVLSRSGNRYTLRNSCQNTYDKSRTDETFVMTVIDQVHFTAKGQSFSSCSTAQVPAWLREQLTGRATDDTPVNPQNTAEGMEARPREYQQLEYKPVKLSGFRCGDNCYLELTEAVEGAAPREILCTARLCADWQARGRLPAALRNKGAKAKFGRANQVDGAGTVMARNVEAVVDLRI